MVRVLAAPIWGSIITLINEERDGDWEGTRGVHQPSLVRENLGFFMISFNGSNPGCGGQRGSRLFEGWDPIYGALGTPNFPELLALFLSCRRSGNRLFEWIGCGAVRVLSKRLIDKWI